MSAKLTIKQGATVGFENTDYRITSILDLETVLVYSEETKTNRTLKISQLTLPKLKNDSTILPDLNSITEQEWDVAKNRFDIIQPLLNNQTRDLSLVKTLASKAKVHYVTIYRWLRSYEQELRISALLDTKKSGGKGVSRLSPLVEDIMNATIEEFYLNKQRPHIQQTAVEVQRRCRNAGVKSPHPNTIRNRINQLSDKYRLSRRKGAKVAAETYAPHEGANPDGKWPLSSVQIDHTPLDIILVDDIDRMPIGKPWLTLAIDVYSRMVAGFHVSFDHPGAMSTGLCLTHAILQKEEWLAKKNIEAIWPIWGIPDAIHCDNAKEFRGVMLERACAQYGIDIHWRPVARPNFGAHIERLLGTFNKDVHRLPGSTFSNIQQRANYPSEKNSALTLSEMERWLTELITNSYHLKFHSGISTTPMALYEKGVFGDDNQPGRGLPQLISDPERLKLDLMPFEERSVQQYGIKLNDINYYHDVLRHWINSKDKNKKKRKFLVRQDPRDISVIYFYDPELEQYFEIPYRNTSYPAISVWELREIKKRLKEEGLKQVDEDAIFQAYEKMLVIEETAVKATKKSRMTLQKRKDHKNIEKPQIEKKSAIQAQNDWVDDNEAILPFDDIDLG